MRIGSDEHKQRFCRDFMATHVAFEPAELPWPDLDEAELARLRAVPFWQEVLFTERRAGAIVEAYAATIGDPLVREAVRLQGLEESRHAELLRVMIERYGVGAEPQPAQPLEGNPAEAFVNFGYGECLDAFLGVGVFAIARRAKFLPESMFAIFDTLMREEIRHIVFFINWRAWLQARAGRGPVRRGASGLYYYSAAIGRLVETVRAGREVNGGEDFSATQASVFLEGFSVPQLIEDCCREYRRRMAPFDTALLRPMLLPRVAGVLLSAMRLGSRARFGSSTRQPDATI